MLAMLRPLPKTISSLQQTLGYKTGGMDSELLTSRLPTNFLKPVVGITPPYATLLLCYFPSHHKTSVGQIIKISFLQGTSRRH